MTAVSRTALEGELQPHVPKQVQVDKNLTSGMDTGLVLQDGRLWNQFAGTRHSYVWPEPAVAPIATITAVDTGVDFQTTSGEDLEIPWHVTPRFLRVFAVGTFAVTGSIEGLHVAIETRALWDSKGTDTGVWTALVPDSSGRSPMRLWNSNNDFPTMHRVGMWINPTFDSTREMVLSFKAIWKTFGNNPVGSTGLSTSREIRLVSLQVTDR